MCIKVTANNERVLLVHSLLLSWKLKILEDLINNQVEELDASCLNQGECNFKPKINIKAQFRG